MAQCLRRPRITTATDKTIQTRFQEPAMRAVIQRVTQAKVVVENQTTGEIGIGLLILLGVEEGDTEKTFNTFITKQWVYACLKTPKAK